MRSLQGQARPLLRNEGHYLRLGRTKCVRLNFRQTSGNVYRDITYAQAMEDLDL